VAREQLKWNDHCALLFWDLLLAALRVQAAAEGPIASDAEGAGDEAAEEGAAFYSPELVPLEQL